MTSSSSPLQDAIAALRSGRPVVLTDAESREHEGDLIYLAETIDAAQINFMATQGRGLVCLALAPEIVDRLQLPLMTHDNQTLFKTPFTISIEARHGVSTGIGAKDRAHTIRTVLAPNASCDDYVSPGHVFPLRAHPNGVFGRSGHTEGAVDLARLAGVQPAAVICEIMAADGESCRGDALLMFAQQHQIPVVSIQMIEDHRLRHEVLAREVVAATLPTAIDECFDIMAFDSLLEQNDIVVLKHPALDVNQRVTVRIHSECLTGDVFGSRRCDCGAQLAAAMTAISHEPGVLIYLRQEGRGIGLVNKLKAYQLQQQGHDTVSANLALGLPADRRHYLAAAQVLKALKITRIKLLTNNPHKLSDCQRCGLEVQREPLIVDANRHSQPYLTTKRVKLGHLGH